jgi:hypothetical protein
MVSTPQSLASCDFIHSCYYLLYIYSKLLNTTTSAVCLWNSLVCQFEKKRNLKNIVSVDGVVGDDDG